MKALLFYSLFFLLYSCNRSHVTILENCSYQDVLKMSEEQSKPIWMILGGGDGCSPCRGVIDELKNHQSINQFTDQFLFYRCDVNRFGNDYLLYIFLMESIPNYYIVDKNGEVVSCAFDDLSINGIEKGLNGYLMSKPVVQGMNTNLKMQNLLLKAYFMLNKANTKEEDLCQALELIEQSVHIEPFFYNLYLESKVYRALDETQKADSCATLALKYVNDEFHSVVYQPLIEELKKGDVKYVQNRENLAKITLNKKTIECGNLKRKGESHYEVEFTNTGKSPLVVTYISTFCGCLTFDWSKKPLLSGEKGTITIHYTANDKGHFSRGILIQSNALNAYEKITIEGNVL